MESLERLGARGERGCSEGVDVPLSLNSFGSSRFGLMLIAEDVLEAVGGLSLCSALETPLGSTAGAPSS